MVVFLVFITVKYAPVVTKLVSEPKIFSDIIQSYGYIGVFVFIFFEIFQVVIAAIPGEVIQIAGGYIYGAWLGTLYLVIGVIVGSIVVFFTSRLLGYPLVTVFVPEAKLIRFNFLMESQKFNTVIFILFLLPGLPKDMLTYIAGLTPVKPMRFFVIATVARLPALFVSAYIGANLQDENYLSVVVLSSGAVILFIVGIFSKDWLIDKIHKVIYSCKPNKG